MGIYYPDKQWPIYNTRCQSGHKYRILQGSYAYKKEEGHEIKHEKFFNRIPIKTPKRNRKKQGI